MKAIRIFGLALILAGLSYVLPGTSTAATVHAPRHVTSADVVLLFAD